MMSSSSKGHCSGQENAEWLKGTEHIFTLALSPLARSMVRDAVLAFEPSSRAARRWMPILEPSSQLGFTFSGTSIPTTTMEICQILHSTAALASCRDRRHNKLGCYVPSFVGDYSYLELVKPRALNR